MPRQAFQALAVLLTLLGAGPACAQEAPVRIKATEANTALITKVPPKYPAMAKRMRLTGTVELDTVIGESGRVESVKVVKGNPLLTASARIAMRQWKFKPIKREGKPVRASCVFAFNFGAERPD